LLRIWVNPIFIITFSWKVDVEAETPARLDAALSEVRSATSELRVLGRYPAASR